MLTVEEVKEQIVTSLQVFGIDRIILFGSYAKGKADEESDLDLFVVKKGLSKEETRSFRLSLQRALIDFQRKHRIGIDLLVDSEERVNDRIERVGDRFYREILEEGETLYANRVL